MKLFMAILLFVTANCFSQNDTNNVVEVQPEFPGGDEAIFKYLVKNIKYPKEKYDNIMGAVFAGFTVDSTGRVGETKILISSGYKSFDDEAIRVVSAMPKWKPGTKNGKSVNVDFEMPIYFLLSDNNLEKFKKEFNDKIAAFCYNTGVNNYKDGDYNKALMNFNMTLEYNSKDIDALYNKGITHFRLNQKKEGCEALKKIQDLKSDLADDLIKKYCSN